MGPLWVWLDVSAGLAEMSVSGAERDAAGVHPKASAGSRGADCAGCLGALHKAQVTSILDASDYGPDSRKSGWRCPSWECR